MGYLQFDKSQLINLEYSLSKEIIRTNRAGSYASTTIVGCNTRKYHGLLACPRSKGSDQRILLLSSLDVTIVHQEKEFNLGIHKFQGDRYIPRGHKYIRVFQVEEVGETIYRVGGVILKRESALTQRQEQILIQFTLLESQSPVTIRFRPFLAFRNIHELTKANDSANTQVKKAKNGVVARLYEGLPPLYMQFSAKNEYKHQPDWYFDVEYPEEMQRGYAYKEDLFVPGYFEKKLRKGESIIFSAGTKEVNPAGLKKKYNAEKKSRLPRNSFRNCLLNSAEQLIVKRDGSTEIIAGLPWFGAWSRDSFLALPGLLLTTGNYKLAEMVLDTTSKKIKSGLFPVTGDNKNVKYNSSDASLWFIWSLQQFEKYVDVDIWQKYGRKIKSILNAYRKGTLYNIHMLDNGLIWAGDDNFALTWMDAVTDNGPVTPRTGMTVEVNALWYNAVKASLIWAARNEDKAFVSVWTDMPEMIKHNFLENFWDDERAYLADVVNGDQKDYRVRPNMVIAAAMEHNMLTKEMKNSLLNIVEKELLTPRGLRSLSPKDPDYKGLYRGNQEERDTAYHQGTVWPWFLEHFTNAYLDVHRQSGLSLIKRIFFGFETEMTNHGVGSVSEVYDGDPPHQPGGAILQAWSVAALLRMSEMIDKFSE
ncbi:MAG: amylo-alpha-1,6-glucosidase [Bacteroidota bacterium]